MSQIRKKTNAEYERLLYREQNLLLVRELLNNRRLLWAFSKQEIAIKKLHAELLLGNDEDVILTMKYVSEMRLNRKHRLDFYYHSFTFYVQSGVKGKARESYEEMKKILSSSKRQEAKQMLTESTRVMNIYIDKDTSLIPKLIDEISSITNPINQGIQYYRIAKLYYFAHNKKQMHVYLDLALPLVKHTYYYEIIKQAKTDASILETK